MTDHLDSVRAEWLEIASDESVLKNIDLDPNGTLLAERKEEQESGSSAELDWEGAVGGIDYRT